MTEDEAKTKWCPHARHYNVHTSNNRRDNSPIGTCIASQCMAWRWVQRITNKDAIDQQRFQGSFGMGYHYISPVYENTDQGFCGLAGKP